MSRVRKAITTKAFLGEFYSRHYYYYPFHEVIMTFHIVTLLILFALTLAPQIAGRLQKLEKIFKQTNLSITEERVDWVI